MAENRNPWPVLLVTVLRFFMIMLDTTIVYVATPSIHDVFVSGYVTALRPTVAVAVVVLSVASLSCVLVINRRRGVAEPATLEEIAVA